MESIVTVTSQASRGGGSSHASSSHTTGKAPIPQKRISKASGGRRRKRLKTTTDTIKPESLTYQEPESKPELEPLLLSAEPKQIRLNRE